MSRNAIIVAFALAAAGLANAAPTVGRSAKPGVEALRTCAVSSSATVYRKGLAHSEEVRIALNAELDRSARAVASEDIPLGRAFRVTPEATWFSVTFESSACSSSPSQIAGFASTKSCTQVGCGTSFPTAGLPEGSTMTTQSCQGTVRTAVSYMLTDGVWIVMSYNQVRDRTCASGA